MPGCRSRDLLDAFAERRRLELGARIAARLFELRQDVASRSARRTARRRTRRATARAAASRSPITSPTCLLIFARMRSTTGYASGCTAERVERIVAVDDAQEAGRLFEGLVAQARHLLQMRRATGTARSRRGSRRCCCASVGVQARHAREQRRRRGVDVDADRVHAVLDDGVERARQLALVDVVLVLADADRLRLDLHQFGQRILQAARDRHRAAQRHVEVGEFLRGEFGRRVDRRAGFATRRSSCSLSSGCLRDQIAAPACRFRATPCRCRSRSARRLCLRADARERARASRPSRCAARADRSWRCRSPCRCASTTATLHAGAHARIEAHHARWAGGRGQQQVLQIAREHADRFVLRLARAAASSVRFRGAMKPSRARSSGTRRPATCRPGGP